MTANRRVFLQRLGLGAAGLSLASFSPGCCSVVPRAARGSLPRSTPEAEGVSSAGILAFLAALGQSKHEFHSFVLVRHGRVVAEHWWAPYAARTNHTMYSMSKSFTSTSVGFAVAEGKLSVNDKVTSFFPDDLPSQVSDHLAALRIKDLLTMSVGNEKEPTQPVVQSENWVKTFLAQSISHAPGTVFLYNSAATYMLSAIVQKVTGQKIIDWLKPRLFEPLGIEGMTWETCPRGICTGGWGLSIQTEGLAKFGQLYLQKGQWQGRQILPAAWVDEATTFKIQQPVAGRKGRPKEQDDWLQGYCYQFWRCRHNAFRGDGAFGQFTIVMPEQDAVLAITSETKDMQGVLDLVWEHLLPAMKPVALSPDNAAQTQLAQKLDALSLAPVQGQAAAPAAARIAGKTFKLEANELGLQSATLAFQGNQCVFTARDAQGDYPIVCGLGEWLRGETSLPGTPPRLISGGAPKVPVKTKIATSGAWKDDRTFEFRIQYYETPHHDTAVCVFDGDKLTLNFQSSIAAMRGGKDARPALLGKL